jgi:hypothetical protein
MSEFTHQIWEAINYGSTGSGSTTLVLFTHRKRYFHCRMSYLICKVFVFVFAVWLYCRVLGPVFTYGSLDFEDKYRIEMIKMKMKMFQNRMRILWWECRLAWWPGFPQPGVKSGIIGVHLFSELYTAHLKVWLFHKYAFVLRHYCFLYILWDLINY